MNRILRRFFPVLRLTPAFLIFIFAVILSILLFFIPPDNIYIVFLFIIFFAINIYLIASQLATRKNSAIIGLFVFSGLLLQILGMLDIMSIIFLTLFMFSLARF